MTNGEGISMNRDWVLFNLREATKELTRTIVEIETNSEYDDTEFSVAMQHLYHHLNTAWNGRGTSPERAARCSQEDFYAWRTFPTDIPLE